MRPNIEIDASVLSGRLRSLSSMQHVTDALDGVARDMASMVAMTFRGQKDPWGKPWEPLSAATIKARRKGRGSRGPQILRDTGVLQNSITSARTSPLAVEVGTTTPYAGIHQFGGNIEFAARSLKVRLRTVKRDGKKVTRFAKDKHKSAVVKWGQAKPWTVRIPARPFLPMRAFNRVDLPPTWAAAIQRRLEFAALKAARPA